MPNLVPSVVARLLVEHEVAPRRERFRKALLHALQARPTGGGPAGRDWTMSRVHELCAAELADRVRIAADALRRAYAEGQAVPAADLAGQLKLEVDGYLNAELADLARDEHLVTKLLDRLPRAMPGALPPTGPSPLPDQPTAH